jgi:hypothetical protein
MMQSTASTANSKTIMLLAEHEVSNSLVFAGSFPPGEMVAIRTLCENLGLDRSWQVETLKKDERLGQLVGDFPAKGKDGKMYEMLCLPLAAVNEWLWKIRPTEKCNVALLDEYKKNLVCQLMEMLRFSLNEVVALREEIEFYERRSGNITTRTMSYMHKVEEAGRLKVESGKLYKEAKEEKDGLMDLFNSPNQIDLF